MSQNYALEPVSELENWVSSPSGYYLVVSRLLPYKNVEEIVRSFADVNRRLVVVGRGPEAERIRAVKTSNVVMLSDLSDGQMAWLYKHCRALVAASYEDYGLTPIEAGVWGRPTVALRFGGFLDTVREGTTGMYFGQPDPASIRSALDQFETMTFDGDTIKRHVSQFTEDSFATELYRVVDELAAAPADVS
jgi:glycosyltransferase involved in cell wall biosynthesis